MKTGSRYSYIFKDDSDIEIQAGERTLRMSFQWPEPHQEQYDLVDRRVKELSASDPLIGNDNIVRDYDWLEYYNSIPAIGAGLEEWIEEQTILPQSIANKSLSIKINIINERKVAAEQFTTYMKELDDLLHYHCTIIDDNDNTVVCSVRPGGWYNNQDLSWAIRFTADVPNIKKGQMNIVTAEIEVYNGFN